MININLNFSIKDLSGKDIDGANAGKLIANALVSGSKGDAIKYFTWATKLFSGDEISLDKSDFENFKNFIEKHDAISVLVKGQVLDFLLNIKNK